MVYATTIHRSRPHSDRKIRKFSMPPSSARADITVTESPENGPCHRHLSEQTSRCQKDQKMVHASAIHHSIPDGDRKTRKCAMPPSTTTADLTMTERSENGPCHCHLPERTSRWQKDQKILHATAIRQSKPHSDRKTRKSSMPPSSTTENLTVTERPENGPCHCHPPEQTTR